MSKEVIEESIIKSLKLLNEHILKENQTLLSSLEGANKEIEGLKKNVNEAITFLAASDMKWDQAMRILFRIVDKEYPF